MVLPSKQVMSVVFVLTAALYSGGEATAAETQDTQARLLADIAFQYADLETSQRSLSILDQAQRSVEGMTNRCFQANPLVKVAGGYRLVGQDDKGDQLLAEAVQTAQAQEATGCSSSATSPTESLANRAREYAEGGHLDLAVDLGRGLQDPMLLAGLAGYLFERGQPRRARQLQEQALALAQTIDEPFYKNQTLTVMAHQLRLAGHTEQALQVLEASLESNSLLSGERSSEGASLQISAALYTAQELVALQAEQQALDLLDQVVPEIAGLESSFPADQFVYWAEAAALYGDLGRQSEADAILATALAAAEATPNDEIQSRDDALSRVAGGYVKLENIDQALQIAPLVQSAILRTMVLQEVAIAYAASGDADAAIALVQSIGGSNSALIGIVRHYLAQNQPDQAWDLVQTQQVQGIAAEVALGYIEAEQPEQALEVVKASELESLGADAALANAKAGQAERAASGHLDYLRPAIARELAQQQQFDAALQVAQSITDDVYQAQALVAIAAGYSPTAPVERGVMQRILARLTHFWPGRADDSDRQNAIEVLEQALQITQSL
ncbi:hypothetical protein IQ254_05915 [Nodosilinea sp. LEGE 07088]|uniref:hypothetical protein n=1 Tax=Nodosilinea sp. LEGE 07088 TaxID=2777968 RepID=UPI001882A063|nr:hypothetical protein [Nodosilinea sp. LEGE 07088]MBE9136742.1 hypothetical protein [Nodosilinea sp. LEGE 07088]